MVWALEMNLLSLVGVDDRLAIFVVHETAIAGKPAPTGSAVYRPFVANL